MAPFAASNSPLSRPVITPLAPGDSQQEMSKVLAVFHKNCSDFCCKNISSELQSSTSVAAQEPLDVLISFHWVQFVTRDPIDTGC